MPDELEELIGTLTPEEKTLLRSELQKLLPQEPARPKYKPGFRVATPEEAEAATAVLDRPSPLTEWDRTMGTPSRAYHTVMDPAFAEMDKAQKKASDTSSALNPVRLLMGEHTLGEARDAAGAQLSALSKTAAPIFAPISHVLEDAFGNPAQEARGATLGAEVDRLARLVVRAPVDIPVGAAQELTQLPGIKQGLEAVVGSEGRQAVGELLPFAFGEVTRLGFKGLEKIGGARVAELTALDRQKMLKASSPPALDNPIDQALRDAGLPMESYSSETGQPTYQSADVPVTRRGGDYSAKGFTPEAYTTEGGPSYESPKDVPVRRLGAEPAADPIERYFAEAGLLPEGWNQETGRSPRMGAAGEGVEVRRQGGPAPEWFGGNSGKATLGRRKEALSTRDVQKLYAALSSQADAVKAAEAASAEAGASLTGVGKQFFEEAVKTANKGKPLTSQKLIQELADQVRNATDESIQAAWDRLKRSNAAREAELARRAGTQAQTVPKASHRPSAAPAAPKAPEVTPTAANAAKAPSEPSVSPQERLLREIQAKDSKNEKGYHDPDIAAELLADQDSLLDEAKRMGLKNSPSYLSVLTGVDEAAIREAQKAETPLGTATRLGEGKAAMSEVDAELAARKAEAEAQNAASRTGTSAQGAVAKELAESQGIASPEPGVSSGMSGEATAGMTQKSARGTKGRTAADRAFTESVDAIRDKVLDAVSDPSKPFLTASLAGTLKGEFLGTRTWWKNLSKTERTAVLEKIQTAVPNASPEQIDAVLFGKRRAGKVKAVLGEAKVVEAPVVEQAPTAPPAKTSLGTPKTEAAPTTDTRFEDMSFNLDDKTHKQVVKKLGGEFNLEVEGKTVKGTRYDLEEFAKELKRKADEGEITSAQQEVLAKIQETLGLKKSKSSFKQGGSLRRGGSESGQIINPADAVVKIGKGLGHAVAQSVKSIADTLQDLGPEGSDLARRLTAVMTDTARDVGDWHHRIWQPGWDALSPKAKDFLRKHGTEAIDNPDMPMPADAAQFINTRRKLMKINAGENLFIEDKSGLRRSHMLPERHIDHVLTDEAAARYEAQDPATMERWRQMNPGRRFPLDEMAEAPNRYTSDYLKPTNRNALPREYNWPVEDLEQNLEKLDKSYMRRMAQYQAEMKHLGYSDLMEGGDVSSQGEYGKLLAKIKDTHGADAARDVEDMMRNALGRGDMGEWNPGSKAGKGLVGVINQAVATYYLAGNVQGAAGNLMSGGLSADALVRHPKVLLQSLAELAEKGPLETYRKGVNEGVIPSLLHDYSHVEVVDAAQALGHAGRVIRDAVFLPYSAANTVLRTMLYAGSEAKLKALARDLRAGGSARQGALNQLGSEMRLFPEEIDRIEKGEHTQHDLNKFQQQWIKHTSGTATAEERPNWMHSTNPLLRMLGNLRGSSAMTANRTLRGPILEARNGRPARLMLTFTGAVAGAYALDKAWEQMFGPDPRDKDIKKPEEIAALYDAGHNKQAGEEALKWLTDHIQKSWFMGQLGGAVANAGRAYQRTKGEGWDLARKLTNAAMNIIQLRGSGETFSWPPQGVRNVQMLMKEQERKKAVLGASK